METKNILIVDDDALIRAILKDMVSGISGFAVVGEAGDGLEGLEVSKELVPDIVILDLIMPKMNDIQMAREIVKAGLSSHLILCSTIKDEAMLEDAKASGITAFLKKPPVEEDIVSTLKSLL